MSSVYPCIFLDAGYRSWVVQLLLHDCEISVKSLIVHPSLLPVNPSRFFSFLLQSKQAWFRPTGIFSVCFNLSSIGATLILALQWTISHEIQYKP